MFYVFIYIISYYNVMIINLLGNGATIFLSLYYAKRSEF